MKKRVMAFYYSWYRTPEHSDHWHGWNFQNTNPKEPPITNHPKKLYDSNNPETINKHLRLAKEAGIDTLITSWWGPESNFSIPIKELLTKAREHDIKITPYVESVRNHLAATIDELKELTNECKHESSLKMNGKPVIFIYQRAINQFNKQEWIQIKKEVKAKIIADTNKKRLIEVFDGVHNYCPLKSFLMRRKPINYYRKTINECNKRKKITCFTVIPGYDDRVLKRKHTIKYWLWQLIHGQRKIFHVKRANGKTYEKLWKQGLKINPDWILITSFNEWFEGTEIEPSKEHGKKYLQLTKKYSKKFKSQDS